MGIIVWGMGDECKKAINDYPAFLGEVKAFTDNDARKWGGYLNGIPVISPVKIKEMEYETIVIMTRRFQSQIYRQCVEEMMIPPASIVSGSKFLDDFLEEKFCAMPVIGRCRLCHLEIRSWLAAGRETDVGHRIVGGGLRNSRCPYCGSIDRSRWVYYVLNHFTDIFSPVDKTILHFAPEEELRKKMAGKGYYSCDVVRGRGEYVVDMTDIPFRNGCFDYIIANHVLEHIEQEEKAVSELCRVLKDEGTILLSFPVCPEMDTLECAAYDTDEAREKHYGQKDHVRLYGRDYKERLEGYGLRLEAYSPYMYLNQEEIVQSKYIADDVVLLCRKA